MAINKDIPARDAGVDTTYHRIVGIEISHIAEPDVPGCIGSVIARIASYASQEARDSGAAPLATHDARIRFGADVADNWKGGPIAAMKVNEPTRADVYAALQQIPAFQGGVEI